MAPCCALLLILFVGVLLLKLMAVKLWADCYVQSGKRWTPSKL
jgi:hypothetical protein